MSSVAYADMCRQAYVSDKFKMFSFLDQTLFHVIHSRRKYYANIYDLEVSFIFHHSKKVVQIWDSKFCVVACRLHAKCKFYYAESKLVIVSYLYIYEPSYCEKNGEIFISWRNTFSVKNLLGL